MVSDIFMVEITFSSRMQIPRVKRYENGILGILEMWVHTTR